MASRGRAADLASELEGLRDRRRVLRRAWKLLVPIALCVAALPVGLLAGVIDPPRGSLWQVIRVCQFAKRAFSMPFPCLAVEPGAQGYAVLRDFQGRSHFIVAPAEPVAGLESPPQQAALATAAWWAALALRPLVSAQSGTPIGDVVLAINPRRERSQDQYHIHVGCPDAVWLNRIRSHSLEIGPAWTRMDQPIDHVVYWVRRVSRSRVEDEDPFVSLRQLPPSRIDPANVVFTAFGMAPSGDGDLIQLATRTAGSAAEDVIDQGCSGR